MQTARDIVTIIELVLTGGFSLLFLYQFFYAFYVLVVGAKEKPLLTNKQHKFGVIVSARNEEHVIGQLIDSVQKQNYPAELIKMIVVADNCTDATAIVCRERGAYVLERKNDQLIGKGYALDYLFEHLKKHNDDCDAYIVLDADNLIDKNFVSEINKGLNRGYKAVTSYRNSKNYGSNWISAGYSLWFLREAKYLNNARMLLNTSCAISGTGFCVCREIIEENGGWPFHLLTEDMEFTVDTIVKGGKIGYCGNAVLYDEQPVKFSQSWNQRMRWVKGFYQVFGKYAGRLFKGIFKGSFACYDMLVFIIPGILGFGFTSICALCNVALWVMYPQGDGLVRAVTIIITFFFFFFCLMFLLGFLTMITEGHNIRGCSLGRKIWSLFTFPVYMMTYIPIGMVALFKKVDWKPIQHTVSTTIEEIGEKTVSK